MSRIVSALPRLLVAVISRVAILILVAIPIASVATAAPPFKLPAKQDLARIKSVKISTNKGEIFFELFPLSAPWHVANFKYLADQGFYRNSRFHLHYPGYIIQGGAPRNNPDGGPGYSLPPEFNNHKHIRGALGMARPPNVINRQRRSNGSQFHILLSEAHNMDGSYTIFGQLIGGDQILDSLQKGDVIEDVTVYVTAQGTEDKKR